MDLIDRDEALEKMADYVASGYADNVEDFEEYSKAIAKCKKVDAVPLSVITEIRIEIEKQMKKLMPTHRWSADMIYAYDKTLNIIKEKVKEHTL